MNVWFYDSEQYLIFCFSWCGYLYLSPCLQRVEIVYITIFWKVSVKKKMVQWCLLKTEEVTICFTKNRYLGELFKIISI